MSTPIPTSPLSQAPAATSPKVHFLPGGLEGLKRWEKEIATYLRELPRLLDEGHESRYALVHGEEILTIWDTQADAIQAGRERFGLDPIFVIQVDRRHPQRYALVFEAAKEMECR